MVRNTSVDFGELINDVIPDNAEMCITTSGEIQHGGSRHFKF